MKDRWLWIAMFLPVELVAACAIRVWANFSPEHNFETKANVSYWRAMEQWGNNSELSK